MALRRDAARAQFTGPAEMLSYAIVGITLVTRLIAALRRWRARAIWRKAAPAHIIAPVA